MGHYDGMSFRSLDDVYRFVEKNKDEMLCIGCGARLSRVYYYYCFEEHDGGLFIESLGKKLWIWVQCSCGYQNALWKLFRQVTIGR